MRKLTNLTNRKTAERLKDILYAQDIDSDLRTNQDGSFSIWIHLEDQIEEAHGIYEEFIKDPDKQEYASLSNRAERIRKEQKAKDKRSRYKTVDVRLNWRTANTRGPFTITLMIICVGVAVLTEFGDRWDIIRHLTIADFTVTRNMFINSGFVAIQSGQIWRLITPSLLHFGMLHLIFNMWWLYDWGNAIENKRGPLFLGILIAVISIISNAAQYMFTKNPIFGGMSGVIYGLLGYIWMLGKFNPTAGLYVPKFIVTFMLVWLVLGFTDFFSLFGVGIANYVHLFGLIVGTFWGYIASGDWKRRMRR